MFYLPTAEAIETVGRLALPSLHFSHRDVLDGQPAAQHRRHHDAERAAQLTSVHDNKSTIYFRTDDGHTLRVRAKVLTAHTHGLTLKGDVDLPLRAVVGITA